MMVKRYEPECITCRDRYGYGDAMMDETPDGDWVAHEDYAALERERDGALAEVERIRGITAQMAPLIGGASEELRSALAEVARMRSRIGEVLSEEGCDCDCGHDFEGHDEDCERCLGCRVEMAMGVERAPHERHDHAAVLSLPRAVESAVREVLDGWRALVAAGGTGEIPDMSPVARACEEQAKKGVAP